VQHLHELFAKKGDPHGIDREETISPDEKVSLEAFTQGEH
jgi:hypothetical protein